MSVVVDASVLVAATTDSGKDGLWAETVIAGGELMAPELLMVETASVLRGLERMRELTQLEATAAHRDLITLNTTLLPYEPFAERIWELRSSITPYDAWYVAAAETLDIPLATLDIRLTRSRHAQCKFWVPS